MQTVGVLGGAGFIGSYVTQKFLNEGYTVKVSASDQIMKTMPGKRDEYVKPFRNIANPNLPLPMAK
jgi:nucleoside-diphosphate-sugar epimerase